MLAGEGELVPLLGDRTARRLVLSRPVCVVGAEEPVHRILTLTGLKRIRFRPVSEYEGLPDHQQCYLGKVYSPPTKER
jgi:hypothetical protein